METTNDTKCKCSGTKKLDPNAIKLEETTVDFYKVQDGDNIHYCFEGVDLDKDELYQNIKIGQNLLQDNDRLVISTTEPIIEDISIEKDFNIEHCLMEDNNFYTIITRKSI